MSAKCPLIHPSAYLLSSKLLVSLLNPCAFSDKLTLYKTLSMQVKHTNNTIIQSLQEP